MPQIGRVSYVVREHDEAIRFFVDVLGFDLVEDTDLADGKRWVVVAPRGGGPPALLLARAATQQASRIGDETGGRVFPFLHTHASEVDHQRLIAARVRFEGDPRHEPYGTVAVFADLHGNRWDLIEPRQG